MPEHAEFVRIMSLQKSKGLTSKVVIVLGCIEGLIPFVDSKERTTERAEILREQRRFFYVAMTRPTEILIISSFVSIDRKLAYKVGAVVRHGAGAQTPTVASRFLGELGPNAPEPKSGRAWRNDGYD